MSTLDKVPWTGTILAVQPRITLVRSFDERHHAYRGYVLRVKRTASETPGEILVAVGESAHKKHQFRIGMFVRGVSLPVENQQWETATLYKTSGISIEVSGSLITDPGPPFTGIPPDLAAYRMRGHRRLDVRTYEASCTTCIWGCRMPVELILDQWDQSRKKYRFETFCYGPKSCPRYHAGATRKAPGRGRMVWEEEDWVDQEATAHRGEDE